MHRLPSSSAVHRFRLVAILFCLNFLFIASSFGLLFYAILAGNKELVTIGISLFGITLVTILLQAILAPKTRCPLCLTPVLAHKSCSRNRKAKTMLGSFRLRVAVSIFFKGYFSCQYCNEPTSIEVRVRRNYHSEN